MVETGRPRRRLGKRRQQSRKATHTGEREHKSKHPKTAISFLVLARQRAIVDHLSKEKITIMIQKKNSNRREVEG